MTTPRFQPPADSPEQAAQKARERKHFLFATILIIGVVLLLPIAGAVYVLLMEAGILPWPQ